MVYKYLGTKDRGIKLTLMFLKEWNTFLMLIPISQDTADSGNQENVLTRTGIIISAIVALLYEHQSFKL